MLSTSNAAPEGVSYAIIFCNLLVPLIEKITIPNAFGKTKTTRQRKSGKEGKN
jgi:Na+-translocating ferredoxin:NAD+ oxidoreductase RnfD subunit